jgi:hypothetical protein
MRTQSVTTDLMKIVESSHNDHLNNSPIIQGDRFISIRGGEDQEGDKVTTRFDIKATLFDVDYHQEEQNRRAN